MDSRQIPQIRSERSRVLQPLTFSPSVTLTRNLPTDSCYKSILFRLSGSIATAYASGTPVADSFATFDNLVEDISVVIGGGNTIKSVRPHLLHMQQLLATTIQGERAASAAAAAATDNFPVADAGFPYGTDTQVTTVRESVVLWFENLYVRKGKEWTWLNLKGASSAEIRIKTKAYSSLLGFGNTAPVVYSASTFQIEMITSEQMDVPAEAAFDIWRQSTQDIPITSQITGQRFAINVGNFLQGLMFLTRNGAAGSTTTATGKLASNLVLTDIVLKTNGSTPIKATNFKALQAENRIRFGVSAPYASSVSRLDGVAYLDMLSDDERGDLATALDLRKPLVNSCDLELSSSSASVTSYTNPCIVTVMADEIIKAAG